MSARLVPLPSRPMEPDWWTTLRAHVWANREELGVRVLEALAGAHTARIFQLDPEHAHKVLDPRGRPREREMRHHPTIGALLTEEHLGLEEDMEEFSLSQEEALDLACALVWAAYRLGGGLVPEGPPCWGRVGLQDIPWAWQSREDTKVRPLAGLLYSSASSGLFARDRTPYLPKLLGAEADPEDGLDDALEVLLAVAAPRESDPKAGYALTIHIADVLYILSEIQDLLWLGRTAAGEAEWVAPA